MHIECGGVHNCNEFKSQFHQRAKAPAYSGRRKKHFSSSPTANITQVIYETVILILKFHDMILLVTILA